VLEMWRMENVKKTPLTRPRSYLSHTQRDIEEFLQVFQFFDVNQTKTMHMNDLYMALRALGFTLPSQQVEDIIELMNVDGDKYIDFSELCLIIDYVKKIGRNNETSWVKDSFRLLDRGRTGNVSVDLLTRILEKDEEEVWISTKDIKELHNKGETIEYQTLIDKMFALHSNDVMSSQKCDVINKGKVNSEVLNSFDSCTSNLKQECLGENSMDTRLTSANSIFTHSKSLFSSDKSSNDVKSENVDTVEKAIAGPILITSSIAVLTEQKCDENVDSKIKPTDTGKDFKSEQGKDSGDYKFVKIKY